MTDRPHVVVLAGPNGAGKTTASRRVLRGPLGVDEFVNVDLIALGISAFHPEVAALQAGRVMLARLAALAGERKSFAFETTLASRSFAPWLRELLAQGFHISLLFFWLPSADQAIARVAERVRLGGHHVPDDTVRRRYRTGIANFFALYMPIATAWRFYDNSAPSAPRLVAAGNEVRESRIVDPTLWRRLRHEHP